MAFLEVLTRTFGGRPELLHRCTASLQGLIDPDWIQTILVDGERRGVAWAVGNLATVDVDGEWVWVLDDDDFCCDPGLIGRLKAVVAREDPQVIMVKVRHGEFGILPPPDRWRRAPTFCWCSTPNVIVRADVWDEFRHGWAEEYAGDFAFMKTLWEAGLRFAWMDRVVAEQPAAMHGAAEGESLTPPVLRTGSLSQRERG